MAAFTYLAQSRDGARRTGQLEAASRVEAAQSLRKQGLLVLGIEDGHTVAATTRSGSGLISDRIQRFLPVVNRDLVAFFRHLAMMIRAGITLTNALRLQAEEQPKQRLRTALATIQRQVQGGTPFSRALRAQRLFPAIAASIVSTAEETGELSSGLDRIADYLEYWNGLKKKLIQSFVYPGLVFVVAVGVTSMLVFNFIPKLERYLAHSGKALPWITQTVFDVSKFFRGNWPWLLLGICSLGTGFVLLFRTARGRRGIERVLCNLPVLGTVVVSSVLAQLSGIMAVMLRSGLSLVGTLSLVREMMRLAIYDDALANASRLIVAGRPLREALAGPMIPQGALSVIAAGEESGTLVESFKELERFFSRQLEGQVAILSSLVEPVLILFVGGIVGVVYFALFSALMRLI